ncbi:MAG: hypothetical protein K9L62_07830 [Vallitaleaceae bacterium]|nr:hypothetical protein [Vallitaleaceae bacterium]
MKIEEFASRYRIRNSTVRDWLEKEFIPGAKLIVSANNKDEEWELPKDARKPYTKARAKKRASINISILKAIVMGYQVLPKLYDISDVEFNDYIEALIEVEMIRRIKIGGVSYYNATLKGEQLIKQKNYEIAKILKDVLLVATGGLVTKF